MIWFTSDTHFGHENVLKFTDRPWETIWQMNDAIVDSINGRVAVDDELYILGDFSFKMTAQSNRNVCLGSSNFRVRNYYGIYTI